MSSNMVAKDDYIVALRERNDLARQVEILKRDYEALLTAAKDIREHRSPISNGACIHEDYLEAFDDALDALWYDNE